MASVEEHQLSEELADIDLNDPELAQAASKIQKQFRGFKRASGETKKTPSRSEVVQDEKNSRKENPQEEDELADIDLRDPELEKAAVKIQSTFKGFKMRHATQN